MIFPNLLAHLGRIGRRLGIPCGPSAVDVKIPWDAGRISDEWFGAHFGFAADLACEWLATEIELSSARLLDFGCGDGITDLAIALKHGPRNMIGIDINNGFASLQGQARQQLGLARLPSNLQFVQIAPGAQLAKRFEVDAALTWSTFEHIERGLLDGVVSDLFALLPSGGVLFLQIEPLYYAPFGSHLGRFIKERWAHLLMDEATLWAAVAAHQEDIPADEKEVNFHTRNIDEYKRFVFDEYLKLNRLTADELVALFCRHGFRILREERRWLPWDPPAELLERYPRELLVTNEILLLMRKD